MTEKIAAVAYSLWDCQHDDKLSDNPSMMDQTFKEARLFIEWLDRFGFEVTAKQPASSDDDPYGHQKAHPHKFYGMTGILKPQPEETLCPTQSSATTEPTPPSQT